MWPNTGRPTAVGRDVNEPITYDNHMKRLSNMFRCLSGSAGHLAGTVSIWPKKTSWYASRPTIAHYATHSRLLIHHLQSYKYPFSSLSLSLSLFLLFSTLLSSSLFSLSNTRCQPTEGSQLFLSSVIFLGLFAWPASVSWALQASLIIAQWWLSRVRS